MSESILKASDTLPHEPSSTPSGGRPEPNAVAVQDPSHIGIGLSSSLYACYVDICYGTCVEPSSPERMRDLVGKWNAMLSGEHAEPPE
jgi:hypothetical protein